jgi:hypothetical protein
MWFWLLKIKENVLTRNERGVIYWLITGGFAVVMTLEYLTPPDYVFGYLYSGTILLANSRLSCKAVFSVTLAAAGLTLLNLFVPGVETIHPRAGSCDFAKVGSAPLRAAHCPESLRTRYANGQSYSSRSIGYSERIGSTRTAGELVTDAIDWYVEKVIYSLIIG